MPSDNVAKTKGAAPSIVSAWAALYVTVERQQGAPTSRRRYENALRKL